MKISQIALRNFRSAQNVTLNTDAPRVYICGRNGAGKSSVRDAIRWTLRGVCAATDAKGQGWEQLIPAGTTLLAAGVYVDGFGKAPMPIERSYRDGKRTLQIDSRDNDMASSQTAVYQLLETEPQYLDAVLETDHFLKLHHADAKAMILRLLDVRIPVGEESLTLAQLDVRYKKAFDDRTAAKVRLKGHVVPAFTVNPDQFPSEEIEERLKALREELRTLTGQVGVATGRRAALEEQLRRVQARPVQPTGVEPDHALLVLLRRELGAETARVTAAATQAQSKPIEPSGDVAAVIQTLIDHQPKKGCVLDSGVECKTAKIIFTNRVKFLRAQPTQEAPETVLESVVPPVSDPYVLNRLQTQVRDLEVAYDTFRHATAANQQRQSDIDGLTAQINSLPAEQTIDSATLETLQARIAKGEKVLEVARAYWSQKAVYDRAVQTQKELSADVERLELLVETLGPNGARVQALKSAIDRFEGAINPVLAPFGWTVKFELEPWNVSVNGRDLDAYSESEQFRIGVAMQMAVAHFSNLDFMVVDRLDMLDTKNRAAVIGMLLETKAVNQIIMLATREDEQPLPVLPDLRAYRLGTDPHGRTVILESTETVREAALHG